MKINRSGDLVRFIYEVIDRINFSRFSRMTNDTPFYHSNPLSLTSQEFKSNENYEQQLVRQTAMDALMQHSYLIMHSLSHHEHPFKMRSRMMKVLSELPDGLQFWKSEEQTESEIS
jgi:hypothetical protein